MSRQLDPRLAPAAPSLRPMLVRLTALQLVGAAATLAQAAVLAEVVARVVLGGGHEQQLAYPLVLLAAVAVARAGLAAAQEWLVARASARVRSELRLSVLAAVTRLGPTWADRQPVGRLAAATGPGIESLDGYVTRALPAMTAACVVPGLVWLRIVLADWRSGVVLVLTLPLVPLFMVLVGVTTRRRMEARYAALAGLAGHFLDLVEGLSTLKIYGQAKRQVATVRRATEAYRRQTMETLRVVFLSGLVLDLIATLSVAVVAVSVGLRLDQGHLDLRSALVVLLLAPELFAPLRAVGAQHHAAEEGRAAVTAALDLIAEAGDGCAPVAAGAVRTDGAVVVRSLTVDFAGRSAAALSDVDLSIDPGTLVVVQGRSGAGKSTLLAVLLGFVEPTAGVVDVGDAGEGDGDRADRDLTGWRGGLAWVPQRPRPTQRDVAGEVGLGDPDATQAEVLSAVAACHAPHPLTLLGEDGALVSAGQRRRVALARALLRARAVQAAGGVPILLLDEPSEDLDRATEDVVASVISGLAGRATVLMVTHSERLAMIAERRLELADGRVVADEHRVRVPTMPAPPAFPVAPASVGPAAAPGSASWRMMLTAAAGLRRRLLVAVALAGVTGLAGVALTATSVWLICRAAQHPNLQALAVAVVGVRTFALARALLRYGERLAGHDVALRLLAEVRAGVFVALEPLAPAGLAEFRRGDLLRRFVSDVDGVQEGLVRAVIPLAGAVITGSGAVVVAALVSPMASLALAAGLLAGLVVAPLAARTIAGSATALSASAGLRDERSTALLGGLAELTAYGHVGVALDEVAAADVAVVRGGLRPAAASATGAAISGLATGLTLVLVLAAGARAVAGGGSSAVGIGVLVAAVLAGTDGLAALPVSFAAWSRFRTGIDRVALLLAAAPPVPEPACAAAVPAGDLSLGAHGLALSPGGAAATIIADATFAVLPGQRVVVSGPSGCGKSTLLKAALRLLPAYGGKVELAGEDRAVALADLGCDDVPPLVAGSLQGDHVFNASLLDNLLVARPLAGEAEVAQAVAVAGLDDFVGGLPGGLATSAGPDGAALSGGQRQRLLLARALLAAPQVLVLDEPTAHLDETTERAVLAQLLVGTSGRTVLMTSHRRLPREDADLCLQLVDGVLVAEQALLVG